MLESWRERKIYKDKKRRKESFLGRGNSICRSFGVGGEGFLRNYIVMSIENKEWGGEWVRVGYFKILRVKFSFDLISYGKLLKLD